MSWYPLGAVSSAGIGTALGIDMQAPAFFRIGFHADLNELYLAYDLALTPEKSTAHVRFCQFGFEAKQAFRGALARYYQIFPQDFQCRTPEQGLWMPFAKISAVKGWEDFGFKFKEGDNETAWDDQHGMITFRYTEPLTWWMAMPDSVPRTIEAATAFAKTLATEKGDRHAESLTDQRLPRSRGTICRQVIGYSLVSRRRLEHELDAGHPAAAIGLFAEMERRDSATGYTGQTVRPTWMASTSIPAKGTSRICWISVAITSRPLETPLVFCAITHKPALFRGLIAFEYVRQIARDVHAMDRLMMANSTPIQLCWLAPQLEVMGTETDWNPAGQWRPMSDSELLYRRALCKGKPYCFLMNSEFENFSHELVERYMRRALAYGMFPGFFSHNASEGHYFSRPELYDRDRDLFQRYVPLCRRVAEAGWEPITAATSSDEQVYVERFGNRLLTVYNDSSETRSVKIQCDLPDVQGGRDLLRQQAVIWREGAFELTLPAEDVAVIEVQ